MGIGELEIKIDTLRAHGLGLRKNIINFLVLNLNLDLYLLFLVLACPVWGIDIKMKVIKKTPQKIDFFAAFFFTWITFL